MANIEHDQIIWVRHDERDSWKKRHFKEMRGEDVVCYADGFSSSRTRMTHVWSQFNIYDPSIQTLEVWFQ